MREGFEPSVGFYTYNALAKRRFRPLSHLTELCGGDKTDLLPYVKVNFGFRSKTSFPGNRDR